MNPENCNNNNNNNNRKQLTAICGNKTTNKLTSTTHNHYCTCDLFIKLLKAALTLCFILSISLFISAAFSSHPPAFSSAASHFFSLSSFPPSPSRCYPNLSEPNSGPTRPEHLLFSLSGSANTWRDRRKYSQLWWSPNVTRGYVWLDKEPPAETEESRTWPELRVSSGPGWAKKAQKDSDRMARILKESFELGMENVRWFVMGDDDTVFFIENLVMVLSKYDDREMYLVGGNSESVEQDVMHGYGTAFGGGGFAVSYPLACQLVRNLDECIERYHNYYGSDEKVAACVADLGVPLTRELGFHQLDIRGDPYGLLAAHPVAPLVSLHHLDAVKSLFPGETQVDSLKLLMQAYHLDPGLAVQQSFCYDHKRKWSVSISWGYTAQLYPSLVSSRVLSTPLQTFRTWRSHSDGPFLFNTRPLSADPCERPIIYYLDQLHDVSDDKTMSIYKRVSASLSGESCNQSTYKYAMTVEKIVVTALKTSADKWLKAPRRQCCEITNTWTVQSNLKVKIRACKPRETMSI